MRIIQVVNVRWFNATSWYALSLSRLLERAGHQVLALVPPGTETSSRAQDYTSYPLDISLNSVNPFIAFKTLYHIRKILISFRPDVVNCHRGEGMFLWGLLKMAGHDFALVRTRGDQRPPKGNIANRHLHARLSDAVIATNSRTAEQCRRLLGVKDAALHMIPGGVDRSAFIHDPDGRTRVRRAYGFADTDLVVGLLGRLDPVKGQRELIETLSLVKKRVGRSLCIRLMLVGSPANISFEDMEDWLRRHGMREDCVITGRVDDVAAHISAMDLGVVASQGSEAIARAALEIMSCGTPLVGTDVGVMPDLLAPEALAPAGNAQALAELLERALSDAGFRLRLQQEQAAAMTRFSHERFLERTLAVYDRALRARARR